MRISPITMPAYIMLTASFTVFGIGGLTAGGTGAP